MLTRRRYAPLLADNPRIDEVIGLAPGDSLLEIGSRLRADSLQLPARSREYPRRADCSAPLVPGRWHDTRRSTGSPARSWFAPSRTAIPRTRRSPTATSTPRAALDVVPDGGPAEFFSRARCRGEGGRLSGPRQRRRGRARSSRSRPARRSHQALAAGVTGAAGAPARGAGCDVVVVGGAADQTSPRGGRTQRRPRAVPSAAGNALRSRPRARSSSGRRRSSPGDTGVMHMATARGHTRRWRSSGRRSRRSASSRTRRRAYRAPARPGLPPLQQSGRAEPAPWAITTACGDLMPESVYGRSGGRRMTEWDPAASCAARGCCPRPRAAPGATGIFALWLTVRVAQDLLRDAPPPERAHRRRRRGARAPALESDAAPAASPGAGRSAESAARAPSGPRSRR